MYGDYFLERLVRFDGGNNGLSRMDSLSGRPRLPGLPKRLPRPADLTGSGTVGGGDGEDRGRFRAFFISLVDGAGVVGVHGVGIEVEMLADGATCQRGAHLRETRVWEGPSREPRLSTAARVPARGDRAATAFLDRISPLAARGSAAAA